MPDTALLALARTTKLQARARKMDVLALLRAMIVAAATGYGGRQADVMRLYLEGGAEPVVRGSVFHKRLSVGVGTAIDYHVSPARDHDSTHLAIDDTWSGLGVLLDLGMIADETLRLDGKVVDLVHTMTFASAMGSAANTTA